MIDYYDNGNMLFDEADIFINRCEVRDTPIHAHSFTEIAFVAQGEGVHKIGDMEHPCRHGEIYIINHDIPHQFVARENGSFLIYNCIFMPEFIDFSKINSKLFYDITYSYLLKTIGNDATIKTPRITLSDISYPTVETLYEEMLSEFEQKEEGYLEVIKADILRLVVFILRTLKTEKDAAPASEKNQLLEKAIDYIHSNFYEDITIEDLCMQVFLSRSQFCRLFKEYSGITVKEFTQKIRINEACRLLRSTDKKVAEIAFDVGYSDVKHFNSLFKKMKSETPDKYRRRG